MPEPGYIDDPTIENGAHLWRRIIAKWVVRDDNRGGWRVSSAAFDDSRDGSPMSVLLADVVVQTGRGPAEVIMPGGYLASITAGAARACGQGIARTPEPDEPAHASVFGSKARPIKKRIAAGADWVIGPTEAS